MAAVEAQGLSKSFRALWGTTQHALKAVSLQIPAAAAFGLIGPNGEGKTTFIKLLLGVAQPTGGSVRVLGGEPEDVRVRQRIGDLPERLYLPAALRARHVLRSVATLTVRPKPLRGRQTGVTDLSRMTDRRQEWARARSGGERRKSR